MSEESTGRIRGLNLRTDDGKYSAAFGLFGIWIDVSVFDNSVASSPIIKTLFTTPASAVQFKVLVAKILNEPDAQPIEMEFTPWNKELNRADFKSSIAVGRDNERCIYVEMRGDVHKEAVRFYLVIDKGYQLNNMVLPKQSMTEAGARALITVMETLINQSIINTQYKRQNQKAPLVPSGSSGSDEVAF